MATVIRWTTLLLLLCGLGFVLSDEQRKDCMRNLRADLVFIVDATEAIDQFAFEYYVKDYINDIVKKMHIGEDGVLASILLYSDQQILLATRPEQTTSLEELLSAIRKIPHLGGPAKAANAGEAIRFTLTTAFPPRQANRQQNVKRIVLLITSGRLGGKFSLILPQPIVTPLAFDQSAYYPPTSAKDIRFFLNPQQSRLRSTFGEQSFLQGQQGEINQAELFQLQLLAKQLSQNVDYVFSIGIANAYTKGVQTLANRPDRVMLLDASLNYADLNLEKFDPTLSICPLMERPTVVCEAGSNQLVASNGIVSEGPNPVPGPTVDTKVLTRLFAKGQPEEELDGLYTVNAGPSLASDASQVLRSNHNLKLNQLPQRGTFADAPSTSSRSVAVHHFHWIPQIGLVDFNDRNEGVIIATRENLMRSNITLLQNKQQDKHLSPGKGKPLQELIRDMNQPNFLHTTNPAANVNLEGDVGTWQEVASHGGSILLFSVKAESNLSISDIYAGYKLTEDRPSWYIHPTFHRWSFGSYQQVLLELWKDGQPVVQLTFDASNADRYSWFEGERLVSSYPWTADLLRKGIIFTHSRTEPFGIMAKASENENLGANCEHLSGYLLVVDFESPITACRLGACTPHSNSVCSHPTMVYTIPQTVWDSSANHFDQVQHSPPRFTDQVGQYVHYADELRIYAKPHSLAVRGSTPEPYSLLLVLDITVGISFRQLWYARLESPPSQNPLKQLPVGVKTPESEMVFPPCNCWFRSRALETWHRHRDHDRRYSMAIALTGFQHLRLQTVDDLGRVTSQLMFDTRGAPTDAWFSADRLRQAWPWDLDQLTQNNVFIQFGVSKTTGHSAGEWKHVALWIGEYPKFNGIHGPTNNNTLTSSEMLCRTVLIVLDHSHSTDRVPKCLQVADTIQTWTESSMFVGMSRTALTTDELKIQRQVIIWSE